MPPASPAALPSPPRPAQTSDGYGWPPKTGARRWRMPRQRARRNPENRSRPTCRHLGNFGLDRVDEGFNPGLMHAAADNQQPAAPVRGWPAVEPGGRVEDMLNAVDHRRPVGALGNV